MKHAMFVREGRDRMVRQRKGVYFTDLLQGCQSCSLITPCQSTRKDQVRAFGGCIKSSCSFCS